MTNHFCFTQESCSIMPDHIIVRLGMRLVLIGDGLKDASLQITDEQLPTGPGNHWSATCIMIYASQTVAWQTEC